MLHHEHHHQEGPPVHLYSMIGCVLSKVETVTYLGVTVASNLQWEPNISGITAKANRTLGVLRRNLRSCPRQLRQRAYFSLVRSKLEYASAAWDPYLIKDIAQLESVQRRGARFVMKDHRRRSSVTTMLGTLEWDSLQEQRKNSRISIMKKIVSGRVAINSDDYLTQNNTSTRSLNSDKFKHYSTKTEVFKNSYFPSTIPQWNNTPDQTVNTLVELSARLATSGLRLD